MLYSNRAIQVYVAIQTDCFVPKENWYNCIYFFVLYNLVHVYTNKLPGKDATQGCNHYALMVKVFMVLESRMK